MKQNSILSTWMVLGCGKTSFYVEVLCSENPRLIYGRMTGPDWPAVLQWSTEIALWPKVAGFGQGGNEFSKMAGHDNNYIALSGQSWCSCYITYIYFCLWWSIVNNRSRQFSNPIYAPCMEYLYLHSAYLAIRWCDLEESSISFDVAQRSPFLLRILQETTCGTQSGILLKAQLYPY